MIPNLWRHWRLSFQEPIMLPMTASWFLSAFSVGFEELWLYSQKSHYILWQRSCWGSIGRSVHPSRMLCPLCSSLPNSWIIVIFGTNTTHPGRCVIYHFQVNRSKVKVTLVIRIFSHICSMARQLFDWFASYVALIKPMNEWCVAYHLQVNSWKVKFTWVIQIFAVKAVGILVDHWSTISSFPDWYLDHFP